MCPPAEIGMALSDVDTPALLLDLDVFERNLQKMSEAVADYPVRLRPHAKTHKCSIIALRQIALGAVGVCCQKVSEAEALMFLAAGTLSSLRIAADSLGLYDQPTPLLDNDMYLVPMLLTGNRVPSHFRSAFTMGEAVLALDPGVVAPNGVHLQFYSFHDFFLAELGEVLTALPKVVQRAAWAVLNNLLLCFVYLSGQDSVGANASVRRSGEDEGIGRIHVDLNPCPESRRILKRVLRHLWKARQVVGFVPLTLFAKTTPLGFSGHIAGSLPMCRKPNALQTDCEGRLAGTRQVFIVDAAAIPALPAQNSTYTVMANAMRVADIFSAKAG